MIRSTQDDLEKLNCYLHIKTTVLDCPDYSSE